MRPPNDKRILQLREKRSQIDAEILRIESRLRSDARKEDARRKILIGAVMLQEMQDRPEFDSYVRGLLNDRLTRPRDRELFDISPETQSGDTPTHELDDIARS